MAELVALQENQKIKEFQQKLFELRSDGVNKIAEIKQTAAKVKKNPMIEYDKKPQILADCKKQLEKAREISKQNAKQDKILTKQAVTYANSEAKVYIRQINAAENEKIRQEKLEYAKKIRSIRQDGKQRINSAKS